MKRQYDNIENPQINKKYRCDIIDKKRKNINYDELKNKKIKEEDKTIYCFDIYNYDINNNTEYSYIK